MKSYTLTAAPAIEPVTLGEVLGYLRADSGPEDALLETLVGAARSYVETLTGRALIEQTWTLRADNWECDPSADEGRWGLASGGYYGQGSFTGRVVTLDRTPLASVTSVKYYPAGGGAQATMSAADYTVDTSSEPGRIVLNESASWPSLASRPDAVEIVFVAGYGDARTDVPAELRLAVEARVNQLYTDRVMDTEKKLPSTFDAIITKYRVRGMVA